LDEIQRYLMEGKPKDAWRRAYCEPSSAIWKTRIPPKIRQVLDFSPHSKDKTANDDNNMSVISDIKEATIFPDYGSKNQATRQAIGKNVVKISCLAPKQPSSKMLSRRLDFTSAVVQKLTKRVRFGALWVQYHQ
jgi:hypothetical protein